MKAKMLNAVMVLSLVGWVGVAGAGTVQARGPIWDDVNTTVSYPGCDGCSSHPGALSISNGTCSMWNMRAMLVGTFYWNVYGANSNCINTPQVPQNFVRVIGSNGYNFSQYHHNHSASSYSRSCDRCTLGLVGATGQAYGARVCAQNSYNTTVLTAWYSGYVTCGSKSNGTSVLGYPRLS
jgi:hypothetical protein